MFKHSLSALIFCLTTLFASNQPAWSQSRHQHETMAKCTQPAQEGLKIGDYGYQHCKYHEGYQRVFKQIERCKCHDGGCRPTVVKSDEDDPSILYALIDGQWVKIDPKIIVREDELDTETKAHLFPDNDPNEAHACALRSKPTNPECLILKPANT